MTAKTHIRAAIAAIRKDITNLRRGVAADKKDYDAASRALDALFRDTDFLDPKTDAKRDLLVARMDAAERRGGDKSERIYELNLAIRELNSILSR